MIQDSTKKTWQQLNDEVQTEIKKIKGVLKTENTLSDVLSICKKIVPTWAVYPNYNEDRTYCQFVLTPPNGFSCSFTAKMI